MRTEANAIYQLKRVMPVAQSRGCHCEFSRENFNDFIKGKWKHDKDCKAKLYENLPNAEKLIQSLRLV